MNYKGSDKEMVKRTLVMKKSTMENMVVVGRPIEKGVDVEWIPFSELVKMVVKP